MGAIRVLDVTTALENRRKPHSKWKLSLPNEAGQVWPDFHPSFSFSPSSTIFTIGSCFARNIEKAMVEWGCYIPMLDFKTRLEEWEGRPGSMLNKYTPPNFRNSIEWTAQIYDRDGKVGESDCLDFAIDVGSGEFIDMDTASQVPVSFKRLVERRQEIYDVFRYAFRSEVVIMTPGYIETWLDAKTGRYMAGVLKVPRAARDGSRFKFELRSFEDSVGDMLAAIDIVRERNANAKFLVTTSPVPLAATFTGQDVRTANTFSKSIVRAVCGVLPTLREKVDYFPSYESAILSDPAGVWKPDRIHILQSFVEGVARRLEEAYVRPARTILRAGPEQTSRPADRPCAA